MRNIVTTLTTEAVFSDSGLKRYLLKKTWDGNKPKMAVIMLAPSEASGIELDTTTQLVLNNASRLGYGSVAIVNLFATLNDFNLRQAEIEDPDNLNAILSAVQDADCVVYAPGTGKAKNKVFQHRQEQVLSALHPIEGKLYCLCNEEGNARLQHPLSPAVRTWHLSPLKISELIVETIQPESKPKKKADPRLRKKKLPPETKKKITLPSKTGRVINARNIENGGFVCS